MSAAKEPLEFHAKRPWRREEAIKDPDEEDENDSGKAENGFSLEEVLRLGGTKVTAVESRGREIGAGAKVVPWVLGQMARGTHAAEREGVTDLDPTLELRSVHFPHYFPLFFGGGGKKGIERFILWPSLNVGDPFLLLTRCGPKLSVIGT
jgi:hypothetical protein